MTEDRLEKLERQEAIIKERLKQERAKRNAKERKARNKRLFETGVIFEKATGMELKTQEERDLLSKVLTENHKYPNKEGEWNLADLIVNEFQTQQEIDRSTLQQSSEKSEQNNPVNELSKEKSKKLKKKKKK